MAGKSALQEVVGWIGDFLEWVRDTLGDAQARRAIIADLGGDVNATPPTPTFPDGGLASVKAYRDAADPGMEGLASALADARQVFDALKPFVSALAVSAGMAIDEAFRATIDLLATNYIRLRHPRWYFAIQVASFAEEATSVYGDGESFYGRFGRALLKIFEFILGPVNSWLQFDLTSELDARELSDRSLLPIAGVMAFVEMLGANDVLYGWDLVPGVEGADKLHPAHRATARMLTLAFAHEVADTSATHRGKLMTTLAWVPRIQGGPALFVSLGGGYQADVPIKSPWSFLAEASAAGGVSMMFGGPKKFQFQAPGGSSDARVALALEARPDPLTGTSLAFDIGAGTGVQFGLLRAEASWSAAGAQLKASLRNSAFTIAAGGLDGFLGRLLPDEGVRLPFDFAVGLASDRGAFIEGEVPFIGKVGTRGGVPARLGTRAPTTRAEPPPLPPLPHPQSNAPGLALRIPVGKSLGPITVHDFAFSLLREGNPDAPRFVAAVTTSVSAKIGPVLARVEGLGVQLAVGVPADPEKASLRLFDLDFGLRTPDGVAVAVDAKGVVSGGGFLFHDRARELYAGALQLSIKDRITLSAFGLLSTRMPDGSKGYSLIVFVTAEGFQPIQLGMGFTLNGIGGMLALNRTFDEAAMREGLKNNTLAKLLFPKDPIRNAPDIIRSLGAIFPARRGSYLFGPLAKIGWATPTLVTFDLALIFEFGHRHRLIVLGRISGAVAGAGQGPGAAEHGGAGPDRLRPGHGRDRRAAGRFAAGAEVRADRRDGAAHALVARAGRCLRARGRRLQPTLPAAGGDARSSIGSRSA